MRNGNLMQKWNSISLKNIFLLLFVIISFYWWMLIPIIREALFFTHGRTVAASVAVSLFTFSPTSVSFLGSEKVPSVPWLYLLYYTEPMAELVAFASAFFSAFYIRQKMNGVAKFFIFLCLISATTILFGFSRSGFEKGLTNGLECGVFPFFASLSGLGMAKVVSRRNPRN